MDIFQNIYQKSTELFQRFDGEKRIIGKSGLGRNLYAVKIGDGSPVGIAVYAIHGREFITAELAFLHAALGIKTGSVWILPLINPDGALLSEIGLDSVENPQIQAWLSRFSAEELRQWKADAFGVDLNVNFDADWGKGIKNARERGAANGIGDYPFSETETRALRDFTEEISPDYTVSYHAKGEEIYWRYFQSGARLARDKRIAEKLSAATGYPLKETKGSVGGYKDWCIKRKKIPAFTVEVGDDAFLHPLTRTALLNIVEHNLYALGALADAVAAEMREK
ncbi:MAG: hypothetical protein IJB97_07675 [Clostridia bacterium]|nr:hypothetical protein [Clostridia bacterium]